MKTISVVDFGSQYTQLIARAVREIGVYTEIVPSETPPSRLKYSKGIILSGGPASVYDEGSPVCDPDIFNLGIPVLGICYGMQLIAHTKGGRVVRKEKREYGSGELRVKKGSRLFEGLGRNEKIWMSHGDSVVKLPEDCEELATTADGIVAVIGNIEKGIYGVQFHPEVEHTPRGKILLSNFAFDICNCRGDWSMENFIGMAQSYIRDVAGKNPVVIAVSGGIDSTVAALLTAQTEGIGDVYAFHIDNGLMRKNESRNVEMTLKPFVKGLRVVDASSEFLSALRGITDPEEKRKIIGDLFVDVFERGIGELGIEWERAYLVQGTLYTDMIESGKGVGKRADRIKTHHNVSSPKIEEKRRKGMVVEPNQWIFKDEVRKAAELLGLPEDIVWRHPFPGPGLGIRYICLYEPFMPADFDAICSDVKRIAGDYGFNGFVFPIRTVGIQGDERTYRNLAVITGNMDHGKIRTVSKAITNNVKGINRVAFTEKTGLDQERLKGLMRMEITREGLDLLREADCAANEKLEEYGLLRRISQMPVVLFPGVERPWVGIRPVVTDVFMTARPPEIPEEMPWEYFDSVWMDLKRLGVEGFCLDVSDKPPATIEWE